MAAQTAQSTAPVFTWESTPVKPARTKGNVLPAVLIAAIVLLCAMGFWRSAHSSRSLPMVKVLAASRDIPAGALIGFSAVKYMDVPKKFATRDMVTSLPNVAGHVSRSFLPAGEPITSPMLFEKGGLSGSLRAGERAITLDLKADGLVDHSIYPGDRVDVLAVSIHKGKTYTKTICQSLEVLISTPKEALLARHGRIEDQDRVTLAATGEQAELLTEASDVGKIRLVVANKFGSTDDNLPGANQKDLLPAQAQHDEDTPLPAPPPLPAQGVDALASQSSQLMPPPAVRPAQPATMPASNPLQWMVEVISGDHKETYAVPKR